MWGEGYGCCLAADAGDEGRGVADGIRGFGDDAGCAVDDVCDLG